MTPWLGTKIPDHMAPAHTYSQFKSYLRGMVGPRCTARGLSADEIGLHLEPQSSAKSEACDELKGFNSP
jgi:hypothetical protein